jgi:hypothetical protein
MMAIGAITILAHCFCGLYNTCNYIAGSKDIRPNKDIVSNGPTWIKETLQLPVVKE